MKVEKYYDVEMIYIISSPGNNYSIELLSRRKGDAKLNFSDVKEGIEINAESPFEIKQSFIQLSDEQSKVINFRLSYPHNIAIKFLNKIIIESF